MMDESTDRGDVKRIGILILFYDESSFRSKTVFLVCMTFLKLMLLISLSVSIYKYLRMTWVMKSSLVGTVMELVSCWGAVTVSLVFVFVSMDFWVNEPGNTESYDHKAKHIRLTVVQPQSPTYQTDSYTATKPTTIAYH